MIQFIVVLKNYKQEKKRIVVLCKKVPKHSEWFAWAREKEGDYFVLQITKIF